EDAESFIDPADPLDRLFRGYRIGAPRRRGADLASPVEDRRDRGGLGYPPRHQAPHDGSGLAHEAGEAGPAHRLRLLRLEGGHLEGIVERARLGEADEPTVERGEALAR